MPCSQNQWSDSYSEELEPLFRALEALKLLRRKTMTRRGEPFLIGKTR